MSEKIGTLMKEIRNSKNMTQHELAKKSNVSRSYLNDVENNRYKPSNNYVQKISKGLSNGDENVEYAYFLKFMNVLFKGG